MKTILLCGYRSDQTPIGLERDSSGHTLIERRLEELKALGHEAMCVLAGVHADEQLRQAPALAGADLAYDDSPTPSLAANLRAGLKEHRDEPCFVLPLEIPCPPMEVWNKLEALLESAATYDVVQLIEEGGAPLHFGFPLLITAVGLATLKREVEVDSLLDHRLNYLSVVASEPNPL